MHVQVSQGEIWFLSQRDQKLISFSQGRNCFLSEQHKIKFTHFFLGGIQQCILIHS